MATKQKKRNKRNGRDTSVLEQIYYRLSERDAVDGYTVVTHTLITGQTGTGETTCSGALVQKSHIAQGDGGIVITSKSSDVEDTLRYARACGREGDVIRVTPYGEHRIDALDYIYQTSGDDYASTCTDFLAKMMRLGKRRGAGHSSSEPYWEDTKGELTTNLVIICAGSTKTVNIMTMMDILQSLPRSPEELANPDFRNNSFAMQAIKTAEISSQASNNRAI